MTEKQTDIFNRYSPSIPKYIEKIAPERVGDEDFASEVTTSFLEYITSNELLNSLNSYKELSPRVLGKLKHIIGQANKKEKHSQKALSMCCNPQPESVRNPFEAVLSSMCEEDIEAVLSTLLEKERRVLLLRFRDGLTLVEVAEILTAEAGGSGKVVTREIVRQIENKAIRKLRHPDRARILKDYHY
jgi:RNA polymerase sigma factor (sigma-70 family)